MATKTPIIVTPALLPKLQRMAKKNPNQIFWAFKYAKKSGRSPSFPNHKPILICKEGAVLRVPNANTNRRHDCGAGVNVATATWVLATAPWSGAQFWIVRFRGKDLATTPWRIPPYLNPRSVSARRYYGKFRLFRGVVVKRITWLALQRYSQG